MEGYLKQSTAFTFQMGPFVDSTDGVTPETGLTIAAASVLLSKAGAAFGAKNDATSLTGTGDSHGYYDCVLNATDTGTIGQLKVEAQIAGACPVWHTFTVLPAAVYDSLIAGSDKLEVDLLQIGGVAQSATDLKDFADSGYDPATHKVQGVVLADTCSTVSDGAKAAVCTDARLGNLDAAISSRLPATGYTAPDNASISAILADTGTDIPALLAAIAGYIDTEVAAIKAVTDQLPDAGALTSIAQEATVAALNNISVADVLAQVQAALDEAFTDASSLTANGFKDRLRALMWILRNKTVIDKATGNMTIYKDDGSTVAFSVAAALTEDANTTTRKRIG